MPTPQREPLRKLSRSERTALERIVRRNNERVDVVRRANALLAVAGTGVFIHAAHEAGLHGGTTVADLVARFNRHGLAALRIATGRGRRATYSANERARIVATAQRQPNRRTDGTALGEVNPYLGAFGEDAGAEDALGVPLHPTSEQHGHHGWSANARCWQCRLPGRPPREKPIDSSIDRSRSVLCAYRSANTGACSTNVLRGHSDW
jgi:transposase